MTLSQVSTQVEQPNFFNVIRERRSVRSYDPSVNIPLEELTEMLELATLAPSSSNMQPWRFLVIDSPELKEKLLPIAFNQQQVVEASAVIAVLGDLESKKKAPEIYGQAVKAGLMPEETAKLFVERIQSQPSEAFRQVALVDGGLISMQLMLIARAKGYDTVPMGGYDKDAFMKAFGISEQYVPIMLIAIGKAAKPAHQTTRLPIENVAFFNEMPKP
ncbi:nitroreductase family protein [Paenibacillus sp. GCM10027628]|uniref:nitroreductase family protein n=1 Tax=Paenibacillus sp. GCM10027628 TaxID=3273413 RepID=UPI003639D3E8